MARVTVEDCVDKVPNRFDLVMLAAHRSRSISAGAPLTVDRDNDRNPVVALREIAEETISLEETRDALIRGLQHHVEADEPEEEDTLEMMAGAIMAGGDVDPGQLSGNVKPAGQTKDATAAPGTPGDAESTAAEGGENQKDNAEGGENQKDNAEGGENPEATAESGENPESTAEGGENPEATATVQEADGESAAGDPEKSE